jgi:hypothetical protein
MGANMFDNMNYLHKNNSAIAMKYVVRPERFELPTPWFEAKYSIQLSYERMKWWVV